MTCGCNCDDRESRPAALANFASSDRPLRIRFRHLTADERAVLCNGCGSKGAKVKVPNFLFEASCDHHDFNYWLGSKESDRKVADRQFYRAMRKDVARAPWWKRPWYHSWALAYYLAVRQFGGFAFFHHVTQRTRLDLERVMERERSELLQG